MQPSILIASPTDGGVNVSREREIMPPSQRIQKNDFEILNLVLFEGVEG